MSISELEAANINIGKLNFREDDISFTGGNDSEYMKQIHQMTSDVLEYDVELKYDDDERQTVGGSGVGISVTMTEVEGKTETEAAQIVDEATSNVEHKGTVAPDTMENLADMLDVDDIETNAVTGNAETSQKNDSDDTLLTFVEDAPTDFGQYLGPEAD